MEKKLIEKRTGKTRLRGVITRVSFSFVGMNTAEETKTAKQDRTNLRRKIDWKNEPGAELRLTSNVLTNRISSLLLTIDERKQQQRENSYASLACYTTFLSPGTLIVSPSLGKE